MHMEVVYILETESDLNAIKLFIEIRGKPSTMIADIFANFLRTDQEI